MRLLWRGHRLFWDLSGGRLGVRAAGLPVLELVTTGHRSGEPRSVLLGYVSTSEGPVLAGSNAGADFDPAWVRNLRAAPRGRMRRAGRWSSVRARFLEGDEYEEVWPLFVAAGPVYARYRAGTTRPIPLVLLQVEP